MTDKPMGNGTSFETFHTPCGLTIAHLNRAETEFVYGEVFRDEAYLRHGIRLAPGDCVFDVGANIGLFTLFVKERFTETRVWAFEPSPEIFAVLKTNVERYGNSVHVYPFGIAHEPGQAKFTYYPAYSIISGFHPGAEADADAVRAGFLNDWHARFPEEGDPPAFLVDALVRKTLGGKREYDCALRTISGMLRDTGVSRLALLKIDAEGSELQILAGVEPGDWPKIRQIVMEIHDADGTRLPQIRQILERQRFACVFQSRENLRRLASSIVTRARSDSVYPQWAGIAACRGVSRYRQENSPQLP